MIFFLYFYDLYSVEITVEKENRKKINLKKWKKMNAVWQAVRMERGYTARAFTTIRYFNQNIQ